MTEKGYFVTGTGTEVGKTIVSAFLVKWLDGVYWKPIMSGLASYSHDAEVVKKVANTNENNIIPSIYDLQSPLSPNQAAEIEGVKITMDNIELPETDRPIIVEGAGGILSPINDNHTPADLAKKLGLPVIIVARSGLGTINDTLLTVEALRSRDIPIKGIILNGPPAPHNAKTIQDFTGLPILAEIPVLEPLKCPDLPLIKVNNF